MRIAISCPAIPGHLNPSLTLAAELKRRGHDVMMVGVLDAEPAVNAAGIPLCPAAEEEYPRGRVAEHMRHMGTLTGFAALRYTLNSISRDSLIMIRDLPRIWQSQRIDGTVLDQIFIGAGAAAQLAKLPYVTIANALWVSRDKSSPAFTTSWPHRSGVISRGCNWLSHAPLHGLLAYALRPLNRQLRSLGLSPLTYADWGDSRLAVVAQQPPGFEFPEVRVPDHVHFTGPFHRTGTREQTSFPFERLDGRPLIYVSLGTLQNRLLSVFRAIAAACAGLDAQTVIALGAKDATAPTDLPGNPIVVPFAPQLELLQRASLVITHAGLNTALESLSQGLPMVALPIANDQPGVAARLARIGAAEVIPVARVNEQRVRAAVTKVLTNPSYREAARKMQRQIAAADGVQRAAEIVERALSEKRKITRIDANQTSSTAKCERLGAVSE